MGAKFGRNFLRPAPQQASAQGHDINSNNKAAGGCEATVVVELSSRPLVLHRDDCH